VGQTASVRIDSGEEYSLRGESTFSVVSRYLEAAIVVSTTAGRSTAFDVSVVVPNPEWQGRRASVSLLWGQNLQTRADGEAVSEQTGHELRLCDCGLPMQGGCRCPHRLSPHAFWCALRRSGDGALPTDDAAEAAVHRARRHHCGRDQGGQGGHQRHRAAAGAPVQLCGWFSLSYSLGARRTCAAGRAQRWQGECRGITHRGRSRQLAAPVLPVCAHACGSSIEHCRNLRVTT